MAMIARQRRWAIAVAVALAAAGLLLVVTGRNEPTSGGLTLSEWLLTGWNGSATAPLTPDATQAIHEMGESALPFLAEWTHDNSPDSGPISAIQSAILRLPDSLTPTALRQWADASFRSQRATAAAVAFAVLGERANRHIPELVAILENPHATNASRRAAIALTGIGTNGLAALTDHLADPKAPNRALVTFALGWSPSRNTNVSYVKALTSLLTQCLGDADPQVCSLTVMSLSGRGLPFDRHDPGLASAMTNALRPALPAATRMTAIVTLSEFGAAASNALPHLQALRNDSNPNIRAQAMITLEHLAAH